MKNKSNEKTNINYTIKHKLCVGCGICESACPTKSIMTVVRKGQFVPVIDAATCINRKGCHRCTDICPGIEVKLNEIAKEVFTVPETQQNEKIGRFLECFTGYSTSYDIRYHCASGGMLSQFLICLLERKHIDGAVITAFDPKNDMLIRSFIATTREEILSAKGSKYTPVTLNHAVQDIKNRDGKFIIVGLPCHIHGFRKYEKLDEKFKEKIVGYFGLYCSSGRTFYLTEYIFKERKINKTDLKYFAYRDEGCLGSMVACGISSSTLKPFQIMEPFQHYYHPLRSFFKPRRCLLCIDHFAELADVSFGDIHIDPYIQDKVGINSMIVRNPKFLIWLNDIVSSGCLEINHLEIEPLVKSQYQKKHKHSVFLKIDKLRGRKIPLYDIDPESDILPKSLVMYVFTLFQIFVGKHKSLWIFINFLKKKSSVY
jgi:coenzyme F420 hydrogenase subunit beta